MWVRNDLTMRKVNNLSTLFYLINEGESEFIAVIIQAITRTNLLQH